ncbi:hypothetical protein [Bacillus sp. JCM 19041]|uniref:hypothetical protein n=1 Tax=Bacillus sp. JCM 19041 TaxID=1460637 RepID=UPI0006D1FE5B
MYEEAGHKKIGQAHIFKNDDSLFVFACAKQINRHLKLKETQTKTWSKVYLGKRIQIVKMQNKQLLVGFARGT